jgi:geranylgeranyl diphosphate synthase type 3
VTRPLWPVIALNVKRFPDILQKRTQDNALKAHTVRIMKERTGSFRYTRRVLQQLQGQVQQEITRLGGNDLLVKIVSSLEVSLEAGDEAGDDTGSVVT